MHFAYPRRKSSHPSPYEIKPARVPLRRRRQVQTIGLLASIVLLSTFSLWWWLSGSTADHVPFGTPEVVIVTTVEKDMGDGYNDMIKENRRYYAARHGYATFFPTTTDYDLGESGTPRSWSTIPAIRHAMTLWPNTTYFFFLSSNSLLMNPTLSITSHVVSPDRLESLMEKDISVVPPDSVIKTFSHLKGDEINLVLTQDDDGISESAMILRRGEWAEYFLDVWFDPLYRSYNFQKAERHALEHIVQWHGTILVKLALIPQRIMNSYKSGREAGKYKEGDFVVHFAGCERDPKRSCGEEMKPMFHEWKKDWQER